MPRSFRVVRVPRNAPLLLPNLSSWLASRACVRIFTFHFALFTLASPRTIHDVLILGGGPAGAAAALQLARAGHRVAILEKTTFPRFHVGESLIPADTDVFRRLGLADALSPDRLPQVRKDGVEFRTGDGLHGSRIKFAEGLNPRGAATVSFNAERAPLDAALLDAATAAGAELLPRRARSKKSCA